MFGACPLGSGVVVAEVEWGSWWDWFVASCAGDVALVDALLPFASELLVLFAVASLFACASGCVFGALAAWACCGAVGEDCWASAASASGHVPLLVVFPRSAPLCHVSTEVLVCGVMMAGEGMLGADACRVHAVRVAFRPSLGLLPLSRPRGFPRCASLERRGRHSVGVTVW